jgi:hypothetical protein
LQQAGLSRIAVSLDGPDPETTSRQVRGSSRGREVIGAAIDLGPLRINSTVSRRAMPLLRRWRACCKVPARCGPSFLVQRGGASLDRFSGGMRGRCSSSSICRSRRLSIKTTEAPLSAQVIWGTRGGDAARGGATGDRRQAQPAPRAMNGSSGFMFVDRVGHLSAGSCCRSGSNPGRPADRDLQVRQTFPRCAMPTPRGEMRALPVPRDLRRIASRAFAATGIRWRPVRCARTNRRHPTRGWRE